MLIKLSTSAIKSFAADKLFVEIFTPKHASATLKAIKKRTVRLF